MKTASAQIGYLFIACLLACANLTRAAEPSELLQPWIKRGIIIKPGFAGPRSTYLVSTPSVVKLKEGRLRMYFWASGRRGDADQERLAREQHLRKDSWAEIELQKRYIFAAESAMGNPFQWRLVSPEPILGPDPSGNIRDKGASFQYVLPRDDGPWFMYYASFGSWAAPDELSTRMNLAISHDKGLSWQVLKEPLLPLGEPGSHDAVLTGGMSILRQASDDYWMWYTAGERYQRIDGINRSIVHTGIARSKDGVHWDKYPQPAISPLLDAVHPFEAVTAKPCVVRIDGIFHMWYVAFRMEGLGYRIEYARSENGVDWQRFAGQPIMPLTPGGFDSINEAYPSIVEMDDQLWMFYVGNDYGRTGIGLATIDKAALR